MRENQIRSEGTHVAAAHLCPHTMAGHETQESTSAIPPALDHYAPHVRRQLAAALDRDDPD
jgi:hypothetical protein